MLMSSTHHNFQRGPMAQWLSRWTCDWNVAGSISSRLRATFGNSFLRICHCYSWYKRELGGKQAHHATHWPHFHGSAAYLTRGQPMNRGYYGELLHLHLFQVLR